MSNNFLESQKYIKTDEFHSKFIRFVKWLLIFNTFLNVCLHFFVSLFIIYFFYIITTIWSNNIQIVDGRIRETSFVLYWFFWYIILYVAYILFFKIKFDLKTILVKKFNIFWTISYSFYFISLIACIFCLQLFQIYELFYFKMFVFVFLSIFFVSCINIVFLHKLKVEILLEKPIHIHSLLSFLRKKIYQHMTFHTLEIDKK